MPRRALVMSVIFHVLLFFGLAMAHDWSLASRPKAPISIDARLIIKKANDKKKLPKKEQQQDLRLVSPSSTNEKNKATNLKKPNEKPDYLNTLSSLSQSFAKEVAERDLDEPEAEEIVQDASYFDQVYSLIKASFVVPPHINGPQGASLQASIKIFLASDGSLSKLELISSSGDEHFDKAVTEGTRRVQNFGAVPLVLQNLLRERGIVVELCPFTCRER